MDYSKLSDKELYELSKKYGAAALKYKRRFAGTLPEINRRKLYHDHGMHSIYEYASRVGGLSHDSVNRILNIGEKLKDKPLLNKKFINGEVGWGKIEVVANIATKENEKVWSDRLETMSFGALRALIKDSFVHEAIDIPDPYEIFRMKLRKDTLSRLRVLKQRLEKKNKHPLTWDDTVIEIVKRVKEKAPRPGRGISIAEFREMHKVFKGLCAFPGCEKPAEHIHHPERYALTRSHKNIKPMCKAHHEIAHHGLIENEEKDPKQWKISDQPQTDDAKRKIDQKYLNHRAKFLSDRQSSSP